MASNAAKLVIIAGLYLHNSFLCLAFTPGPRRCASLPTTLLALSSPSISTENVVMPDDAASTGKILEGGHVIDFSSVKADNRAEKALLDARTRVEEHHNEKTGHLSKNLEILGINQQVIDEVGHPLGTFASEFEIRDCASYLISKAPPGLLKVSEHVTTREFNDSEVVNFEAILDKAYKESGEVTSAFAKTFYMGTMIMNEKARKAIWAVYVWCRRTDEIVDAPREVEDDMLTDLSEWEVRLERLWESGEVKDVYDLCLLDVRVNYPVAEIQPYLDMIRGMLMDVPGLGQDRYETFDELHLYCYRVAGTVGLMSLPVFGCASGFDFKTSREPALSLGVAFQLTNILRDVGEDAVQRGRVYLPQEDLRRFGVTEEQILSRRVDDNYRNLMKYQISRARMYYARARRGVFMLSPESRLPVQSSLDAYGKILDKIEENNYDSLNMRAYVDKWEKLSIIPFSWYRTTDLSRYVPLPGDQPLAVIGKA